MGTPLAMASQMWPTATEGDADSAARHTTMAEAMKPGTSLTDASRLWPTARSEDSESCGNHPDATDSLTGAVSLWNTPNVPDRGKESKESKERRGAGGIDLQSQVDLWQTPQTPKGGGSGRSGDRIGEPLLDGQARAWPTPKSRDHKGQSQRGEHGLMDALANMAENSPCSLPAPATETAGEKSSRPIRRLNPRFVAYLMGWPLIVGTGSERWVTEWSRFKSRMRGELSRLLSEGRNDR